MVSAIKRFFKKLTLLLSLTIGFLIISNTGIYAETVNKTKMSATDKDITLSIEQAHFNGSQMVINYRIHSKKDHYQGEESTLIEKPDIFIDGKKINVSGYINESKIGKGVYKGQIKVNTPNDLIKPFAVKFNTDRVLNKSGQWTIKFNL